VNNKDALNTARRHYHAGKLAEAEKIYRQVLQNQPKHAEAMHLLGALVGQRGNIDAAIDLIRRSIGIKGEDAEAHGNLGILLAKQRRFDEAIVALSEAARLRPGDAAILNSLGNVATVLNRTEEEITAYSQVVALKPAFVEAHLRLGHAFDKKGMVDEAMGEYRRVVDLNPDFAEGHAYVGNMLVKKGRLDEAIAAYLKATGIQPDMAAAHLGLGHALRGAGRLEDALAAYKRAMAAKEDFLEAMLSAAAVLGELQRFEEALQWHDRAVQINSEAAVTHVALGSILLRQRGAAEAIEEFRKAVEIDPSLISAWNSLGLALQAQGAFDEAATCFRRMATMRPDLAIAYKNLSMMSKLAASQAEIDQLKAMLSKPNLAVAQRIAAEFALAKVLDDAERFDEAFGHYAQGNSLVKRQRAQVGEHYDSEAFHTHVNLVIETFTPEFFEQRRGWGDPSELPVLVVGMPRSGTTLVQQIAASHPMVHGAGELKEISNISTSLGGTDARSGAMGWTAESLKSAAGQHIQTLRAMDGEALRIIDKQPSNLHLLGLIALLFPSARVVLCRRDPRDTCLSGYFQWFARGNMFSFDLADCGHYYLENERLMDHWLKVLPLKMLEFQYEDVIADLEGQSRRLIDFLGLEWDPACLEFYRTETTILTSSVWQVRQPIYQGSAGRWRRYERHLGPLLKALGR
jgi:tetratricopeptide (TPR) repeat protein